MMQLEEEGEKSSTKLKEDNFVVTINYFELYETEKRGFKTTPTVVVQFAH